MAFSLCVAGEHKVARFDLIVAGEAGLHERLIAKVLGRHRGGVGLLSHLLDRIEIIAVF